MYNVFTKTLSDVLDHLGVTYTNYADDTQILIPLTGVYDTDRALVNKIYLIILAWMAAHGLCLNDDKMEFLIIEAPANLKKLCKIDGIDIKFAKEVFFEKPQTHHDAEQPLEHKNLDIFEIITRENEDSSQLLRHGDIAVKPGRSAIICADSSCYWPKSSAGTVVVPFTLSGYGSSDVALLTEAMMEYKSMTCIRFVNRTTENDYLQISSGNGCWSYLGRNGGPQAVSLGSGCLVKGIIQHELNHNLGFDHEQSRSDRDDYVRIATDFISPGDQPNFMKANTNNLGLEYDYSSVMHYGKFAFSNTSGQPTIIPTRNPSANIGQRVGLSNLDIAKINRLYNCGMCSTISTVGYGFVNSTNYPSQYPNNANCFYLMRTTGFQIVLTFNAFDVESSPNCESDYVTVYDGITSDAPILLNKACGRGSMPTVVSSGNAMLLQFVSNSAITSSGFNAYYQNKYCVHAYTSSSGGTVTSENYPQNYPSNMDCEYYIWAPQGNKISLTFTDFNLEPDSTYCRIDYLSVHNGPTDKSPLIGKYCGSITIPTLVSTGNTMLLLFHSDPTVQMKGFSAKYTIAPVPIFLFKPRGYSEQLHPAMTLHGHRLLPTWGHMILLMRLLPRSHSQIGGPALQLLRTLCSCQSGLLHDVIFMAKRGAP
ncbi:astacin-like metalloendopeptidase [Ambystoma mexicanum]|uniref:astacin-like metalloendopeptidase n=1 Tax=Ambystoma mexicanum TaxID=8296 RepID=UPI0037E71B4A